MSAGGGSNNSKTTSSRWDDMFQNSVSQNMAGGYDYSRNQSMANNQAASNTFVSGSQDPYLRQLYGMGSAYANPGATQAAAMGASRANAGGLGSGFGNIAALTDPNAQIAAQERSLRQGLGDVFRKELMPGIRGNAIASGGFGGGRQGVAEGVASGEIADAYTAGLGDITARANQTATAAASILPALAQARLGNAVAPTTAGLDPLAQLAQILGAPTVLSRATSSGRSSSTGRGGGETWSRGTSRGSTTATAGQSSKSKSSGWDFKFGF